MTIVETATTLMNGCGADLGWTIRFTCGSTDISERLNLCPSCKAIIKAKRECWQEELEFLESIENFIDQIPVHDDVSRKIKELKQALKITESVQ